MAKNIVGVKQAGFLMPSNFLERAVKDAGYLGTAVVHDGQLVINHQPSKPTVDSIAKVQEHFKDSTVIFCFGENAKTRLDEDRLPFLCQLDKDKGDSVAVFLTGNFEGYAVKGSSHIDEYHAFDDYISKKLPKIYKSVGGDLEKFLAELNDAVVQQEFAHSWTHRGFITFLTSAGKSATIFNKGNVLAKVFPWGIVSDAVGYDDKKEAPPAEAPHELSLLERLKLKKSGEAPKPSVPPVEAPKSSTSSAAITAATSEEYEEVSLPKEASNWTNKDKIKWWMSNVGYKPNGYKDMKTKVERIKGTTKGRYAHLVDANGNLPPVINQTVEPLPAPVPATVPAAEVKAEVKAEAKVNPNKVDPRTLPDKKDAPENSKDTSTKHVSMENMPILSPRQKILLKKDFLADGEIVKILGDDFQQMVLAPKNLKEMEDQYAPFWDGLGMEPHFMTKEALVKLGTIDLQSLATFAFHAQLDAKKAELKLASIEKANPNLKLAM